VDGERPQLEEATPAEELTAASVPAPPPVAPPPAPPKRRTARPAGEPRRPKHRGRRILITIIVLAVLGGATAGAITGMHRVYFVGSDRGLVTLYRGLPYDLPFGIHLYRKRYVSSVPAQALTPTERRRLLDHQLRSKGDAADLVRSLERGHGL
jgi:PPM family protein phosphatase